MKRCVVHGSLACLAPMLALAVVAGAAGLAGCGGGGTGGDAADIGPDAPDAPDVPVDVPADAPADVPGDLPAEADAPVTSALSLLDFESAVALTPDGRTALVWTLADGTFGFYDTQSGAFQVKDTVGSPQRCMPTALSASGRVAALHGEPVQAGLWTEAGGWVDLGSLFDTGCVTSADPPVLEDRSGAWDLSDDGHVAVGLAWDGCQSTRAFRWTDAGGTGVFTPLDVLGKVMDGSGQPAPWNRATVVSGDGKVAAGFAQNGPVDRSPAVWNEDGTGFLLDPADEDAPGEVKAINGDGSLVAGDWAGSGFVWTPAGGIVKFKASDSPFDTVLVNAMTGDGTRLLGTVVMYDPELLQSTQRAFVWTSASGVRWLDEAAAEAGVVVPAGVTLANVLSVSADGTVVLGTALVAPDDPLAFPAQKSFVLRLPAPVP